MNILMRKSNHIKTYQKFIPKEILINLLIWEFHKKKYFLMSKLKLKVLSKHNIKDVRNAKEKYNKSVIVVIYIIKLHTHMKKLFCKIKWLLSK